MSLRKNKHLPAAALLLFLIFCPGSGQCEDADSPEGAYQGHNVILLVFDAMRPDRLGCYGYPRHTSPAIDSLAAQGVIFDNAFSQSSVTIMSVASIYASLYPFSHGMRHVSKHSFPRDVYTLAQVMRLYGHKTAWFGVVSDPHTGSAPGMLKGFDQIRALDGLRPSACARLITSWIAQNRKKPFFITVHSYATHEMNFSVQRHRNHFDAAVSSGIRERTNAICDKACRQIGERLRLDPDSLAGVFGREWIHANRRKFSTPAPGQCLRTLFELAHAPAQEAALNTLLWKNATPGFRSFSRQEIDEFLVLLDSAIYEVDSTIVKQVVAALKKAGIFDKTIIIITADHGNEFNEHGNFGHGCYVYDESIRIPLIFSLPRLSGPVRLSGLAESIDVMPTVLGMTGIPIPFRVQGRSWAACLRSGAGCPSREYVFSESVTGVYCVRSRDWKLIARIRKKDHNAFDDMHLFYLRDDPLERNDLIRQQPRIAGELQEILRMKLESTPFYGDRETDFFPLIDERTREEIRKTGYW